MRREPYIVGSYVHVVKRGTRGTAIIRDDADRWRFLLSLLHLNDIFKPEQWMRELIEKKLVHTLLRPPEWPPKQKLVRIIAFCLLDNHFHLLLKEIIKGGVSLFMQKLGTSMANHFNEKYKESGSLFQGAYRSRTIESNDYLKAASAYIQVKNAFELFPGGVENALKDFDRAYIWASKYPYCSLGDYSGERQSPIIEKDILGELFTPASFKSFAKDFVYGRYGIEDSKDLIFE